MSDVLVIEERSCSETGLVALYALGHVDKPRFWAEARLTHPEDVLSCALADVRHTYYRFVKPRRHADFCMLIVPVVASARHAVPVTEVVVD